MLIFRELPLPETRSYAPVPYSYADVCRLSFRECLFSAARQVRLIAGPMGGGVASHGPGAIGPRLSGFRALPCSETR
jgi:hypothetical protein